MKLSAALTVTFFGSASVVCTNTGTEERKTGNIHFVAHVVKVHSLYNRRAGQILGQLCSLGDRVHSLELVQDLVWMCRVLWRLTRNVLLRLLLYQ